ncbi:uncharacterized protein MELLADRAFT_101747 [Melampsora larici-populina 98AG31]|uniref:Uncharacterized protein n=1 Tax=Melampsora larici-populina (strain 98AG31 / pathotype 3-4-7) TaxID=747676 RepID=F4R6U2_MELLP|nr:uncharacterized protein MELLADRAFT_101747 [Melampsora larici-populina 98AG31]EGG12396.1 hypothetical protein MELLADRAFT_101747 [Melampsora larici-populina 98AG31]
MPNDPNPSPSTPLNGTLPFEILTCILDYFAFELHGQPVRIGPTSPDSSEGSDSSSEAASSSSRLSLSPSQFLDYRLVCKAWSEAVISIYFRDIRLDNSRRAQIILDNWTDAIYGPNLSCPVRRLSIRNMWYSRQGAIVRCRDRASPPVVMDQVVPLIKLLGLNLNELSIVYTHSMGVRPAMVKAVQALTHLKELSISHVPWGSYAKGIYDSKSLVDLMAAIPRLECLTIHWSDLGNLPFKPNALSKLRRFSFTSYCNNSKALTHICETAKDSLKVVDISSGDRGQENIGRILKPIQANLEGCFTTVFSVIPTSVLKMEFPKLRVIASWHCPFPLGSELKWLNWLNWPMLQHVRTLVTPVPQKYWKKALNLAGLNAFQKVPNLKHIIFTGSGVKADPHLTEAFKLRGVQCHCRPKFTTDEIMILWTKLDQNVFLMFIVDSNSEYSIGKIDTVYDFFARLLPVQGLRRFCNQSSEKQFTTFHLLVIQMTPCLSLHNMDVSLQNRTWSVGCIILGTVNIRELVT